MGLGSEIDIHHERCMAKRDLSTVNCEGQIASFEKCTLTPTDISGSIMILLFSELADFL